jgi:hypothetical protein
MTNPAGTFAMLKRKIGNFSFLQQEAGDLSRVNSPLITENRAQKQEMDALHKRHDELVAWFAGSDDVREESQLRKFDFTRCSGIFQLRGGSSTSEDLLEVTVPGEHVFALGSAHRIAVHVTGDCQGSVDTFLRIKRLIEALYTGDAVGIRLDIGSGSVAIPTDLNRILVLYSSVESLRISDWIEVIHADDFRFCPNLREVIADLQREVGGFRDCRKLESVDLSRLVEVVGRGAFSADEDGCYVFIVGDES